MDKQNVLVTGSSGFIGTNLCEQLMEDKHFVMGVDKNRPTYRLPDRFDLLDLTRDHDYRPATPPQVIIHLAANSNTLFPDDLKMLQENSASFFWAAGQACKHKARLVYASSSAIYGNGNGPLNAYAVSKQSNEFAAGILSKSMYGLVGLRFFNVFGPHESHKKIMASMVSQWAEYLRKKAQPPLFSDSKETMRDFVYVGNVVDAIKQAAFSDLKDGVYDAGSGEQHSFQEVFDLVCKTLKAKVTPLVIDNPVKETYQVNTQATLDWGWKPKVSFAEGVKRTLS